MNGNKRTNERSKASHVCESGLTRFFFFAVPVFPAHGSGTAAEDLVLVPIISY